jgi:hypothetical protein
MSCLEAEEALRIFNLELRNSGKETGVQFPSPTDLVEAYSKRF